MALLHLNIHSRYLSNNTEISIILPDRETFSQDPKEFYGSGEKYKVLWLLHGMLGDHTDWVRKTNIELYANERRLIVVMPSALNSRYENWPTFGIGGFNMFDFLIKELMPLVYGWLPASDRREDNYIAGLSMGGSGALKYALAYPERFAGMASLSSVPVDLDAQRTHFEQIMAINPAELPPTDRGSWMKITRCGGVEQYLDSLENSWRRLKTATDPAKLPRMFFSVGTEDGVYTSGNYERLHSLLTSLPIESRFQEGPGGHEWRVWDRDIQLALDWFHLLPAKRSF